MRLLMFGAVGLVACDATAPTEAPEELELEGAVYRMRLGGLVIDGADPGAATLAQSLLRPNILLQAVRADDTSVDWRLAFGNDDPPLAQDLCAITTDLPSGTRSGGDFSVGPADYQFPAAASPWTLYGMNIDGTLSADLETASDVTMAGRIDARELAPLVAAAADADELCGLLDGIDIPCGACDDTQNYCADISISGMGAERVEVDVVANPSPSCE